MSSRTVVVRFAAQRPPRLDELVGMDGPASPAAMRAGFCDLGLHVWRYDFLPDALVCELGCGERVPYERVADYRYRHGDPEGPEGWRTPRPRWWQSR